MKTNKLLNILLALVVGMAVFSCVEDDDYDVPTLVFDEPNVEVTNTIGDAKSLYTGDLVDFSDYTNGGKMIISGYVVSNDEAGNFYKTLIIQDKPENPTAAIQIDIDAQSLYSQFKPGRKVYVKLSDPTPNANGEVKDPLGMENMNGVLHIGKIEGSSIGRISETDYLDYILKSNEIAEIVPKVITPSQYHDSYINMLVQIDDMQLSGEELGQPYANLNNTFTVNRKLVNCVDDSETILRNSGFADFKSQLFPMGRGSIVSVFSKYNSDYQLFIRDTEDVMFDDERCDPVFEESFNTATDNTTFDFDGWINYAEEGTAYWMEDVYSGNGYARFSAYGSGESSNIGWLITPEIDLDAQDGELLSFETEHAYPDSGHDPLDVLISTDFDGTEAGIETATWTELTFDVSYIVDSGNWYTFTPSGQIDLSGYSGSAYIAFRYTGSDTANQNMTLDVDNVKVFVP